ncbi:hypothetical protein KO481_32130 [Nocardia sp. NEAU-G5]|uniref:Uncharacterized protein n=1 Tax=Nocardia albiluteola TaxID=2842303 RepID=A0ABS6B764_9NOCA|nr:hypothetical protein [Nocardia albiluteola]MBU3066153.1 hypothetical protein [Nocardia albiluteola]
MTGVTVIDVQPSIYYTAADSLHQSACDLFNEVQAKYGAIAAGTAMAGSYDDALIWAKNYDAGAAQSITLATQLATTMDKYAKALRTIGYNHQSADYSATTGSNKGPAPVRPADPMPAVTVCDAPPPSSGGPGNGLSDVVHLAEKVGIVIPDGDTDKLGAVADAWLTLAQAHPVANLPAVISRIVDSVGLVKSPEAETVITDLQAMQATAVALGDTFADMSKDCRDHATALHDLRGKLEKQLKDLANEILLEIGENLAFVAAASFVSFGLGALVEAARVAEIVDKFAGPIRILVQDWKKARDLKKAEKVVEEGEKKAKEMQRLQQRIHDDDEPDLGNSTWLANEDGLTPNEVSVLNRGPSSVGGGRDGGSDLISAIREDRVTPAQQKDIDAYNKALDKLPAYKGNVVRQTHLSPEQIAEYKPGQPYTEDGYTCTSTNMKGTGNGVNTGGSNVEYRMTSKSGRKIGKYGGTYDEVQFKDHTQFFVHDNYWDPKLGKQIIIMDEM